MSDRFKGWGLSSLLLLLGTAAVMLIELIQVLVVAPRMIDTWREIGVGLPLLTRLFFATPGIVWLGAAVLIGGGLLAKEFLFKSGKVRFWLNLVAFLFSLIVVCLHVYAQFLPTQIYMTPIQ